MITMGLILGCITDLTLTEYKNSAYLNNFTTNEKYINYKNQSANEKSELIQDLDQEAIKNKRLDEKNDYIEDTKSQAVSSLISVFTWFITGFIFFIIHWCLYKRSTKRD
jgi:ATP-dependent Zn protease